MSSTTREPQFIPATPTFGPRGIESVMEYNGLVLNDRRMQDCIVITNIGGIDDPDVRDAREPNPDRDGETALDATYGGRTITLRGYVHAGNLNRLRQLYSQIKDAFDTLQDGVLVFRWLDWKDMFYDSLAVNDYSFDAGTGTVTPGSTGLAPTSTVNKVFRPLLTGDATKGTANGGDYEVILAFTTGALAGLIIGPIARRTASNSHLRVVYEHTSTRLALYKRVAGTDTLLDNGSIILLANTSYYIAARVEGASATYSVWNTLPTDTGTPLLTRTYALSGPDQLLFPYTNADARSSAGIFWTPNSTADRINMLDIGMLNPGDAQITCRKVSKLESNEEQANYVFKRDFLLTLRASDPRFVSRKMATVGGLAPGTDPFILSMQNLGRSPAAIRLRISGGPFVSPRIEHVASGKRISIVGIINAGEWIEIDTARRTVKNQNNSSVYSMLGDDTAWPELERGVNSFNITSELLENFTGATGGGTLNGRVSNLQTWSSVIDDFYFVDFPPNGDTEAIVRSDDAIGFSPHPQGRSLYGTAVYAQTEISMLFSCSIRKLGPLFQSLLARYVNSTNMLLASYIIAAPGHNTLELRKIIAGVETVIPFINAAPSDLSLGRVADQWLGMQLRVNVDGTGTMIITDDTGQVVRLFKFFDAALATGGVLDDGRVGIDDVCTNGNGALTAGRYYDRFTVRSGAVTTANRIDVMYRHSSR